MNFKYVQSFSGYHVTPAMPHVKFIKKQTPAFFSPHFDVARLIQKAKQSRNQGCFVLSFGPPLCLNTLCSRDWRNRPKGNLYHYYKILPQPLPLLLLHSNIYFLKLQFIFLWLNLMKMMRTPSAWPEQRSGRGVGVVLCSFIIHELGGQSVSGSDRQKLNYWCVSTHPGFLTWYLKDWETNCYTAQARIISWGK